MFSKQFTVIKFFGFNIRIDASWVILAILIIWSLAAGYYPANIEALSSMEYFFLGVIGSIGLFASLILHELSHSIVGRKMGLPIENITLFIFGGVAELEEEPDTAKTEFLMAIAGPLASGVLGLLFLWLEDFGSRSLWDDSLLVTFGYLWRVNFILAIFNLLPGFPLDGGRIFRSVLWAWKKDVLWATRIARRSGELISSLMMALGILGFFTGNFIAGIWWFFIAIFLNIAATSTEYHLIAREFFKDEPLDKYIDKKPMILTQNMSVKEAANIFVQIYQQKTLPVVEDDELIGVVESEEVKKMPTCKWSDTMVGQVFTPFTEDHIISPKADCLEAINKMNKKNRDVLFVVNDKFQGSLVFYDLLNLLSDKMKKHKNFNKDKNNDDQQDRLAS